MKMVPEGIARAQDWLSDVGRMLEEKNEAYGNSALNPVRIFSKADAEAESLLRVRIDDKLSRLAHGHAMPDESYRDTLRDLVGYIALLVVAMEGEA